MQKNTYDCIVIGGGQAGLSAAYFLNRAKVNFLIIDAEESAGGSWLHTWDSLKLFSPAQYSSLSGWQMPSTAAEYPTKNELIDYLSKYEQRYNFNIQRNTKIKSVEKTPSGFRLITNQGEWYCKALISATGTANHPFIPSYPNYNNYQGKTLHSSEYINPDELKNKHVLVVGSGNSGAQLLAEISHVASTKWVTLTPALFLPDGIDGRHLFEHANAKYLNNKASDDAYSLKDIVQIATVKEARGRGVYHDVRPFESFYEQGVIWQDGTQEAFDYIIWCTGFRAHLTHLESLNIIEQDKIEVDNTRSVKEPNLWLVGYGDWTGFASATLYGVGKTAKHTVNEVVEYLASTN
jgi:thioredoxin reductase